MACVYPRPLQSGGKWKANVLSGLSKDFHVSNATGIAVGVTAGAGRTVGVGGGTSVIGAAVGMELVSIGRGSVGTGTDVAVGTGLDWHAVRKKTKHAK
jgi:hypothetical protein